MQVGTVRREALRLMFASYAEVTEASTVTELYQNPQYAPYLAGMEMSINRAMLRMQTLGLLSPARVVLQMTPVVTGAVATFDLGGLPDLVGVEGLMCMADGEYTAQAYRWEGGTTLVVPLYRKGGEYVLLYTRRLPLLTPMCPDEVELPIPDALAALVPYYVKSELYEEEDAVGAANARRYFEKGLEDYPRVAEQPAPTVAVRYGWRDV